MKKTGKRQEETTHTWMSVLCALARGGLLALAVTLLVLLLCATAVSEGWLSQEAIARSALVACVLGSVAGGILAARQDRQIALLFGFGVGAMLFVFLLAGGILFYENAPSLHRLPEIFCACLCGGGIAGILSRKKKKYRR